MCEAKGHPKHPDGRRCCGQSLILRSVTYTEIVLSNSVSQYEATAHEPVEVYTDEDGKPALSPTWVQKVWRSMVEVHKKWVRLREKRADLRAEQEATELARIAKLESEAEERLAQKRLTAVMAAHRKLDQASDVLQVAALDVVGLDDDGDVLAKRKAVSKKARKEADKAAAVSEKMTSRLVFPLTPSQEKRLRTALIKAEATEAAAGYLEGSMERAPDMAAAKWNLARARSDWAEAEAELIKAEAVVGIIQEEIK